MAELLAINTTAANSADFTLTGESTALLLTATAALPEGAQVEIQAKTSAGVYIPIGRLTTGAPLQVLSAPGTYRVARTATGASCGVDRS